MSERRRMMMAPKGNFINGYEYVDLGLPSGLLWAKCNVGADEETSIGDYYSCGCGAQKYRGTNDWYKGRTNVPAANDTAVQVMGGGWRMPTKDEFQELIDNCNYLKITTGTHGIKLTSKINGNYIFIPSGGYYNNISGGYTSADLIRLYSSTYASAVYGQGGDYFYVLVAYDAATPQIGNRGSASGGFHIRAVHT